MHRVSSESRVGRSLVSKSVRPEERVGLTREQQEWNKRIETQRARKRAMRDERKLQEDYAA